MNRKRTAALAAAGACAVKRFTTFVILAVGLGVQLELHAHGAHEHGIAQLQVAVTAGTLQMHLESPAINIVGFEHPPKDDDERALIEKGLADLKNPALFVLEPASACTFVKADVTSDLATAPEPNAAPAGTGEVHADVDADYRFTCRVPLKAIRVMLLDRFSGIESLRVQLITDTDQRSLTLDKTNTTIPL